MGLEDKEYHKVLEVILTHLNSLMRKKKRL
jgi:hypothetical protein